MSYVSMQFVDGDKRVSSRLFNKPSNKLMVFFSALRPGTVNRVVYYNRITWVDHLQCNCLFIADPTLLIDSTLGGGYYQGSMDWFGVEYCADIILKVAVSLNITENDILLYGSSQGGFAALAIHAFMRKAIVLAESPQNDLSVITRPNSIVHRMNMLKSVYKKTSFDELNSEYKARVCISKLYESYTPLPTNINIIVKETDTVHIDDHIKPLTSIYPEIDVEIIKGSMGLGGHSAINRDIIISKAKTLLGLD